MRIHLVTVGNRMPAWVNAGYDEYAKRMPRECELVLKEIPLAQRGKHCDLARLVKDEGERMLAAVPHGAHVVALEVSGAQWTTPDVAASLGRWLDSGKNVALFVGGPDGMAVVAQSKAAECWSLSALTFPHPLVRVIVAEQLYRAWSILQNHPYHRS
jgi:23S rRNA (pseudouridine1915-N3)-methyltransferase